MTFNLAKRSVLGPLFEVTRQSFLGHRLFKFRLEFCRFAREPFPFARQRCFARGIFRRLGLLPHHYVLLQRRELGRRQDAVAEG